MPALPDPLPDPPSQRVGIALVGLGAYALGQIAPSFGATRHARLAGLVSGNAGKAQAVADAYGLDAAHVYGYDDFDRIAQDDAIDAVYILLPNTLHREWTERAFAAGKHVLCEKPMAPTAADCRAMMEAAARADRQLMIGYRAQYDPYNLRAIEEIRSGAIGTPRLVIADHGRILDPSETRDQWRAKQRLAGGGSLYDIGIYSVNGARYLTGEEPLEVTARFHPAPARPEIDVEMGISWTLTFPSGAISNGSSSYQVAESKRLHVTGDRGEVTLDPATDYYDRRLFVETEGARRQIVLSQAHQFAAMLDEMALAVRDSRPAKTDGAEGLRDVVILEAILEAARTGATVRLERPGAGAS